MRAGFRLHRFPDCAPAFRKKRLRHSLTALCAALALAGAAGALQASPPPPPRRPNDISKPPAANKPAAPKPTAPATQSPAPATVRRAPADVDVNKLEPYNLPPASREKMRQCGDEWRKLKMAGQSVGLIWRSFAEKCLAR